MSKPGRTVLPATKVILDYLDENGDQKYTTAVAVLGSNVSRSKYDMTKQMWKKHQKNATTAKTIVAAATTPTVAPIFQRRAAPTQPVAVGNVTEALQYVTVNGGLAKVQATLAAQREQLTKNEELVATFMNLATQVSKAS